MNASKTFVFFLFAWFAAISVSERFPSTSAQTADSGAASLSESDVSGKPFGIDKRVPWTTSRIVGTPEPPAPYSVRRVFPNLKFTNPVEIAFAPGSDRLYLAELGGKIYSFPNNQNGREPDLFLDAARDINGCQQVFGLEFHPKFAVNHFVYVCYVLRSGLPNGSVVSRFTVTQTDPPRVEPESEVQLITWVSGGHNGGSLKFGPDGCLYISTGDAASPNPPDPLKTGQDNSDLLSSILRIDVDHADAGASYRVPSDNPFVGLEGTRPEIWAFGFRNPWRMSFDRQSGDLWAGDVGWELWELVFRVEKGGNYGWSIVEGPQSINPNLKTGPTPILPPVKAHPHSEAASVTGGFVYRGTRLKELAGAYVYGDWVTGKIWALRNDGNRLVSLVELADTPLQIICFGEDHSGELFVADYGGGLYQLEKNAASPSHMSFPRRLSETGLFANVKENRPAPGVIPFFVNAGMWSDHARAERFAGLPGRSRIQTGSKDVWLYQSKNEWRYPTNAVLAKTLSLEMESGNSESARMIETQVLHYDGLDWHAYSYRWNETQEDAELVNPEGEEEVFDVKDALSPDGLRKQVWRFHSRAECMRCHNPWANYALAFTASQLNLDVHYRGSQPVEAGAISNRIARENDGFIADNQLRTLSHLDYFDQPLDSRARPKFTDPSDTAAELDERARSWLHANCAHCHREGAGGAVVSHFDYDTVPAKMKAIGQIPSQGGFGLTGARVITPGDPHSSALYYRISTTGQGRMPRIGSRFADKEGIQLVHDWIRQLPQTLSDDQSESLDGRNLRAENELLLKKLLNSEDGLRREPDKFKRLIGSVNGALALMTAVSQRGGGFGETVAEQTVAHPAFQVRDLFERFLPHEKRVKKLGANIRPEEIFALTGDADRGRLLFRQEGLQCSRCHQIQGEGTALGPDLSLISRKYDRANILDNILFPSKVIEPNFISYQVETKDEFSYSGFILNKTADEIVIKDLNAKEVRIPMADVSSLQPQSVSLMPELLLQDMTAQDVADLLKFLSELR